ncbi:MAG TPA: MOSC domain-containing protein [Gemmatimonadales bacterium]
MRVESIQVGQPKPMPVGVPGTEPAPRLLTTAIWKEPVTGPVRLDVDGLDGDAQADRKHHGGLWRAVLMYPAGHYPRWRAEWGREDVGPGGFGENLTVSGLDEFSACLGDRYRIGDAVLEVTSPRTPCHVLARRHGVKDLALTARQTHRHGWYLRVLEPAVIAAGMVVELVARPHPEWTIARAAEVKWDAGNRPEEAARLAACPALIPEWREELAALRR